MTEPNSLNTISSQKHHSNSLSPTKKGVRNEHFKIVLMIDLLLLCSNVQSLLLIKTEDATNILLSPTDITNNVNKMWTVRWQRALKYNANKTLWSMQNFLVAPMSINNEKWYKICRGVYHDKQNRGGRGANNNRSYWNQKCYDIHVCERSSFSFIMQLVGRYQSIL